ncbi:hypothetical protein [Nitrosomonas sp. Nm34]|uniref:hypothetical protein n=1 Tax=Nitrosomonas sp. Nm34 TaxID=1881055 RepID=UPI0008EB2DBB|nr:hypothetical protein [Nitrosomonas sp. Nm34]SFI73498.1 hypothetical protein SAMN05428978_103110 [Nitrosomonas sp. Nm34]
MAYQTINPATGKLIKTYANISDPDLETAVARLCPLQPLSCARKVTSTATT